MFRRRAQTLGDDAAAYRQQVRLAAVQVSGLTDDELASALAYEVEPFSNIPAGEAVVAFALVPDPDPAVRVYDVSVRRRRSALVATHFARLSLALATLAAVAVAADWAILKFRSSRLERELRERSPLQAQLNRLDAARRADAAAAGRILAERDAAERDLAERDRRRKSWPALFDAVDAALSNRAALVSWQPGEREFSAKLGFRAANAGDAADTLCALAELAAKSQWSLAPGAIVTEGAASDFSCTLELAGVGP